MYVSRFGSIVKEHLFLGDIKISLVQSCHLVRITFCIANDKPTIRAQRVEVAAAVSVCALLLNDNCILLLDWMVCVRQNVVSIWFQ